MTWRLVTTGRDTRRPRLALIAPCCVTRRSDWREVIKLFGRSACTMRAEPIQRQYRCARYAAPQCPKIRTSGDDQQHAQMWHLLGYPRKQKQHDYRFWGQHRLNSCRSAPKVSARLRCGQIASIDCLPSVGRLSRSGGGVNDSAESPADCSNSFSSFSASWPANHHERIRRPLRD